MTTSSPPNARPDWSAPLAPSPADGDDVGWLITFSDLVLQLFAFVIVVAVYGAVTPHAAPGSKTTQRTVPSGVEAPLPSVAAAAAPRLDRDLDAAPSTFAPASAWAGDAGGANSTVAIAADARRPRDAPRADDTRAAGAIDTAKATGRADETNPIAAARDTQRGGVPPVADVAQPIGAPVLPRVAALARYLGAFIAARGDVDAASVTPGDRDVRVAFGGRLGFRTGSAELLPRGRSFIAEVQRIATAVPDLTVEVAGYTDDVPIHTREFPSNLELSLARAATVARELQHGDPGLAVRTVALGFGEHHAIAPNDDDANRARNRRVEVRLVARDHSMP